MHTETFDRILLTLGLPQEAPIAEAPESTLCEGCGLRPAAHVHHKEHKGMGGRKRAAKVRSEDPANKIRLCYVCHAASHLEHAILDGFHCGVCPHLEGCRYGLLTLDDRRGDALPAPW